MPSLARWVKKRASRAYRDFHALQNVSLEVRPGESVGIIGLNGSGKSTLLQIIAGTLKPTVGTVTVNGTVAALLELGSGFNPEFTGRENIYLSGSILGFSREAIDRRFGEIVAFAEIGDFIEQPVKTYSSGMQLRLAFAVQSAVQPDILIVDEALAVGDAPFQAKCFARIRAIRDAGSAILFVSHDISTVRTLCSRALCLSHGVVFSSGSAKTVCDDYQLLCMREQGIVVDAPASDLPIAAQAAVGYHRKHGPRNLEFAKQADRQRAGSGAVKIRDCYILDQAGRPVKLVGYAEPVQIHWLIEAIAAIDTEITFGVTIKDLKGVELLSGTDKERDLHLDLRPGEMALVTMPYSFPLRAGRYYFTTSIFGFRPDRKFLHGSINFPESQLLDLVEYCGYFEVECNQRWAHYGPVQLDNTVTIIPFNPSA